MLPSWFLYALLCFVTAGVQGILLLGAAKSGLNAKTLSNIMVWAQLPPLLILYFLGYAPINFATAALPALFVSIAFYISLLARQK